MAQHTSEDNASFSEILEGINKRKRERYEWLHGQIEKKQVTEDASSTGHVRALSRFRATRKGFKAA